MQTLYPSRADVTNWDTSWKMAACCTSGPNTLSKSKACILKSPLHYQQLYSKIVASTALCCQMSLESQQAWENSGKHCPKHNKLTQALLRHDINAQGESQTKCQRLRTQTTVQLALKASQSHKAATFVEPSAVHWTLWPSWHFSTLVWPTATSSALRGLTLTYTL